MVKASLWFAMHAGQLTAPPSLEQVQVCSTIVKLGGVKGEEDMDGNDGLMMYIRTLLGGEWV